MIYFIVNDFEKMCVLFQLISHLIIQVLKLKFVPPSIYKGFEKTLRQVNFLFEGRSNFIIFAQFHLLGLQSLPLQILKQHNRSSSYYSLLKCTIYSLK